MAATSLRRFESGLALDRGGRVDSRRRRGLDTADVPVGLRPVAGQDQVVVARAICRQSILDRARKREDVALRRVDVGAEILAGKPPEPGTASRVVQLAPIEPAVARARARPERDA